MLGNKLGPGAGTEGSLQKNVVHVSGKKSVSMAHVDGMTISGNAASAVREKIVNSSSKVPWRIEESNSRAV